MRTVAAAVTAGLGLGALATATSTGLLCGTIAAEVRYASIEYCVHHCVRASVGICGVLCLFRCCQCCTVHQPTATVCLYDHQTTQNN